MDSSRGSPRLGARRASGWSAGSTGSLRRRASTCGIRAGRGAGIDLGAILQFVLAVYDHEVIGINAGAQADAVAGSLRDGDGINLCGVVLGNRVFGDGIDVSALRAALDSSGGNDGEIVLGIDQEVHIDKLIGEQCVVFVAEDGFELIRARGGIDLVVDGGELACGDLGRVVAVVGLNRKLRTGGELREDRRELILRKAENHRDGLELCDDEQTAHVGSVDNVAGVNEAQADASADRRSDAAIDELELGVVDLPLIGANGAVKLANECCLSIELLLRNDAFLEEKLETFVINLGVLALRLVFGELAFSLFKLHLERARVDLRQKIALVDELAFFEGNVDELPIDAAVYCNGIEGGYGAKTIEVNGEIAPLSGSYHNGHDEAAWSCARAPLGGRRGGILRLTRRSSAAVIPDTHGESGEDENPNPCAALWARRLRTSRLSAPCSLLGEVNGFEMAHSFAPVVCNGAVRASPPRQDC